MAQEQELSEDLPGLALLGAGIFARTQYLPLLRKLKDLVNLKVIWSRSQESSVQAVLSVRDYAPDVKAKWGHEALDSILEDSSIHAVAIVLPAQVQIDIALRAIMSGKHVLQEKPVGQNIAEVQNALSAYHKLQENGMKVPIWAVAENYRFEPGLLKASNLVSNIGNMMGVEAIVELPMTSSNPYYQSIWRRDGTLKGAFILDGGVHFVAGLRLLTGCEVASVGAITRHVDQNLPSPDNMSALLHLENECGGVMLMSYSCKARKVSWRVLGSNGTVEVVRSQQDNQHGYSVVFHDAAGNTEVEFFPFAGVEEEIKAFLTDVKEAEFQGKSSSKADKRSSVLEAFHDLCVIEAMLKSSDMKGSIVHVDRGRML